MRQVVVAFVCNPDDNCNMVFSPDILGEIARNNSSRAVFLAVDVVKCPKTVEQYAVTVVPTFLLFRGSEKLETILGANPLAIMDAIAVPLPVSHH